MKSDNNKWLKVFDSPNEIKKIVTNLPTQKRTVYTYGVWDLLHPGHIKLLMKARELGDYLIVGVVTDEPIRNLKGKNRPIQKLQDRLFIVGSLSCVDAVLAQSKYDPTTELLGIKRVDVLTKGDDWENIPGQNTIKKMGGELIKLKYTPEFSTSRIVTKISGKKQNKHGEPKC